MNKDKFIKAVDEIQASDELKRKAKNNKGVETNTIVGVKARRYKLATVMATFLIICTVLVSASIPKINDAIANRQEAEYIRQLKQELPTVGTLENLKKLLGSNEGSYRNSVTKEESIVSDAIGSFQSTNGVKSESLGSTEALQDTSNSFSKTNIQVEGVDEADIVKTDGNYIYYVSNSKIVIIDAKDSKNMKIVSEIKGDEKTQINEIYINNNKLISIGYKYEYIGIMPLVEETNTTDSSSGAGTSGSAGVQNSIEPYIPEARESITSSRTMVSRPVMADTSIGYGGSGTMQVIVYDITDKANPTEERRVEIDGSYLSSRMIGDNIYVVSNKYLYYGRTYDNIEIRPAYKDTVIGEELCVVDYKDIAYIPESTDKNYLTITGFNINNNNPVNVQTVLGSGQTIYVSQNNLYVAITKYNYDKEATIGIAAPDRIGWTSYMEVYKYKLDNAKSEYVSMGKVNGTILNQFSMDEYNGNFRIATTVYDWSSEKGDTSKNNLYILDEKLNQVGSLENLAKGERIYSVRFMGNRGYIVTFKQVDPLFVIDLANPSAPKVLGELKIPGYSEYLHPYDENHIIGFGKDTKQVNYGYGEVTTTNGLKMSLFDVSDVANPKEVSSIKLGENTNSDLSYNHKALLFSKEKNIFAFPVNAYNNKGTETYFAVYNINLEKGFELRGKIKHSNNNGYDYNKMIERGIYIGDTIFTLSRALVKATDFNTMKEISELTIKVENSYYPMGDYIR